MSRTTECSVCALPCQKVADVAFLLGPGINCIVLGKPKYDPHWVTILTNIMMLQLQPYISTSCVLSSYCVCVASFTYTVFQSFLQLSALPKTLYDLHDEISKFGLQPSPWAMVQNQHIITSTMFNIIWRLRENSNYAPAFLLYSFYTALIIISPEPVILSLIVQASDRLV